MAVADGPRLGCCCFTFCNQAAQTELLKSVDFILKNAGCWFRTKRRGERLDPVELKDLCKENGAFVFESL